MKRTIGSLAEFQARRNDLDPSHPLRPIRRHRASLREALDMMDEASAIPTLQDQNGQLVEKSYLREAHSRLVNICGEAPNMNAHFASWMFLAALDEIVTDLMDRESAWAPMALLQTLAEGRQLLKFLFLLGVISQEGHRKAHSALAAYVQCWFAIIAKNRGVDVMTITIEVDPTILARQ